MRFKRILLLMSFFTILNAQAGDQPWIKATIKTEHKVLQVSALYGDKKTWIGIYKVGTSTAWKNVQAWTWYPKTSLVPVTIDISDLSAGEYEARLFYHNSYKMEAKANFTVKALNTKSFIKLVKKTGNSSIDISHSVGPKAWIGIYPKGSSNSWSNVKSWKWAEKDGTTTIPVFFLKRGVYEARLFYNNSYVLEDKFTFGPMGGGPAGEYSPIHDLSKNLFNASRDNPNGIDMSPTKLHFKNSNGATNEKPWVGIYKKDTAINNSNLLARGNLKDDNTGSSVQLDKFLPLGTYSMAYHPTSNDIQVGEVKTLTLYADF